MTQTMETPPCHSNVVIYSQIIVKYFDVIMNDLNIKISNLGSRYAFSCPVHGSNNPDSGCVYKNNYIWRCFTNGCHEEIGQSTFYLLKHLLENKLEKKLYHKDVIDYIDNLIGEVDLTAFEVKEFKKERVVTEGILTRKEVRSRLNIPSPYFLKLGFSPEILDKYDVGDCKNNKSDMKYRVVVPIYDDDYKMMVGCVGRTKNQQCPECKKYHYGSKCPTNAIEFKWSSKWTVSKDFKIENYFYNLWFAKPFIQESKTVILVEGQSDVWRLEEAGIHNVLGLFGARLTSAQSIILDELSPYRVIIATDNDKTGSSVGKKIKDRLSSFYQTSILTLPKKDFGDMSVTEVQQFLEGKI
jgi:5S rRNA maturation endonuclease (ribonuclease M5)